MNAADSPDGVVRAAAVADADAIAPWTYDGAGEGFTEVRYVIDLRTPAGPCTAFCH